MDVHHPKTTNLKETGTTHLGALPRLGHVEFRQHPILEPSPQAVSVEDLTGIAASEVKEARREGLSLPRRLTPGLKEAHEWADAAARANLRHDQRETHHPWVEIDNQLWRLVIRSEP